MWIELPPLWIGLLNGIGIPAAHLLVSWAFSAMPATVFHPDGFCFRRRHWEQRGRIYQRLFRVRRWKTLLPDAATWFNGFAKAKLQSTAPDYLETFIVETCRGESAHWVQLAVITGFILWTPWPFCLIILAYALASNLPCIINLRHTRIRLHGLLTQSGPGTGKRSS